MQFRLQFPLHYSYTDQKCVADSHTLCHTCKKQTFDVPQLCANVLEVRSLIRVSIPTLLDKIVQLTGTVRWQLRSLPLSHPIFEYSRLQQFINWKGSRLPNQHCTANKSNIVQICVLGMASLSMFNCIHFRCHKHD